MSSVGRFFSWVKWKLSRKRKPPLVEGAEWADSPGLRFRLDRVIEYIAPQWGAERRLSRIALSQAARSERSIERMVGWREGHQGPRDRPLQARGASADWTLELGFDRREAVDTARQLERVNSIAGSVLDRACEHVIGEGFKLKCKTEDEGWNRAGEAFFDEWSKGACDSRGMMTFAEMQAIVFRSWLRDGDVGSVLERDGSLRLVESDEIASKIGGYTRPTDADGVELDRRGRIVAFYVFDYDPTVLWSNRRTALPRLVRVPASDMIFLARRQRAGQTRGMSAFAGSSWVFETADDALESVGVAHHMAAAAGLVLAKKTAVPGNPTRPGQPGEIKMGPGKIFRVDVGETVTQIQPAHPGGTFEILMDTLTRIGAARFGVSLEIANYNFTNANYSNMRAQSLETALASRIKQLVIMKHFCSAVWGWKLANAIRDGHLPPRKDAGKHGWGIPGRPWQDPVVELQAAMGAIDAGLDTRRRVLASRGMDLDEVLDELADERKKMRKLGLPDVRANITRDAIPTTKTISEPESASRGPGGKKTDKNGASKNGHGRLGRLGRLRV